MGERSLNLDLEPLIWARLMESQEASVPANVAQYLLAIEFGEADRLRMQELADRSEAGNLTLEEQAEYDSYLHVGNLLALMQSRARIALWRGHPRGPGSRERTL